MKGIIFNLLEEYCADTLGDDVWETLVEQSTLQTPEPLLMVAPASYPDEDFHTLARAIARAAHQEPPSLLRAFGRWALPRLAERYPQFFTDYHHPADFLKYTGMIHHIEIKKLYQDADTPHFSCRELAAGNLELRYQSKRQLTTFVEGLLQGLADYYRVPMTIHYTLDTTEPVPTARFSLHFAD